MKHLALIITTIFSFAIQGLFAQSHYFEKTFKICFPNGFSSQVAYINFPSGTAIYGYLNITVTGGFWNQLNCGKLTKKISIGKDDESTGYFYFNQISEITDAFGPVANQWNIGDFDNGNRRIPIYHLTNTGNEIIVKVSGLLSDIEASAVSDGMTVDTPVVASFSKTRQYKSIIQDRVGLGTQNPQYTLDVNGTIHAREVFIDNDNWSDFVFDKTYQLPTIKEVDNYIQTNGHLPNIPSAQEIKERGTNVAKIQSKLLQKIEELTLYIIEQDKKIEQLQKQMEKINDSSSENVSEKK